MRERIKKLRELVEQARDGFVGGSSYVLTYSDIINELAAIEALESPHECPTGDHDDCTPMIVMGTADAAPTDPVGCKCDEYPECTHSLYFYMGMNYAEERRREA